MNLSRHPYVKYVFIFDLWILKKEIDPIPVFTYMAIDPAFSQAKSADERALVTFAMGRIPTEHGPHPVIFVLDYVFNHMDPDMIIEKTLELHKKYFYREMVIETIGGQKIYEFIVRKRFQKEPFLLNYPLLPNYVDYHDRGKEDRIWTYFKTIIKLGQLYIRPDMEELQEELDDFLNCKHLHLLDALEMGCRYAIPSNEQVNVTDPKSQKANDRRHQEQKEIEKASWRLW